MAHRVAGAPLDFAALRDELEVPGDFAAPVQAAAEEAAAHPAWPDADATDIPFVTIDPAGSKDLDQALHVARTGTGFRVWYAIADVAAFVRPGSALDAEALRRGETLYFPDARVPLHPLVLSEGAASLLPDQVRPAVLWQIDVDTAGAVTAVDVHRARVRSRQQYDYETVQQMLDGPSPPADIAALRDIGRLCLAIARADHAIDLAMPEQQVVADGQDGWTIRYRTPLEVEAYNAQISILTGRCAAQLMLQHRVGILRTVPTPQPSAVHALQRAARALHVPWPSGAQPGDVLASVDRSRPEYAAFVEHAAALLRGSGYVTFNGSVPANTTHAGIGAPYSHVTAPLRRLIDRYGTEVCLAVTAGSAVPDWVTAQFAQLPDVMHHSDQLAHTVDRAVVDTVEAWLLHDHVGETFAATVIDADPHAATIVLDRPAVRARCGGDDLQPGARITARLTAADVATREVHFELVA